MSQNNHFAVNTMYPEPNLYKVLYMNPEYVKKYQKFSSIFDISNWQSIFRYVFSRNEPVNDTPKGSWNKNITVLNQYCLRIYCVCTAESFDTTMFLCMLKQFLNINTFTVLNCSRNVTYSDNFSTVLTYQLSSPGTNISETLR